MPSKHDVDHHPKDPKGPKGPPKRPKERELAVALTVAVLRVAKVEGDLATVEATTLGLYERMYAAVTADR